MLAAAEVDQQQFVVQVGAQLRRHRLPHVRHRRERRHHKRQGSGDRLRLAVGRPARVHGHRVLADRNDNAEGGAEFHADGADGVEERLILAGLSGRGHPVGGQLDVAQRADAGAGDVGDGLGHRHAARRRRVDERQRCPFTHRHCLARVGGVAGQGDAGVCHGHLPRPDHLVAMNEPGDAAVADGDQEALAGHRRHAQNPLDRVGDRDAGQRERRTHGRLPFERPLHARCLAEEHGQ